MLGTSGNETKWSGQNPTGPTACYGHVEKKWLLYNMMILFYFFFSLQCLKKTMLFDTCILIVCNFIKLVCSQETIIGLCTFVHVVLQLYFPFILNWLECCFFFIFDMYTECDMFSRDKIMLWQSSPDALIININFFFIVGLGWVILCSQLKPVYTLSK